MMVLTTLKMITSNSNWIMERVMNHKTTTKKKVSQLMFVMSSTKIKMVWSKATHN
jgi:hypothetical protein